MGEFFEVTEAGIDLKTAILPNKNIIPPQITVDQNNYSPTGLATCNSIHLDSSEAVDITGLQAPTSNAPQLIFIVNVGGFTITLTDNDALSTAANRFLMGADLVIDAETTGIIKYDSANNRWRASNTSTI